MPPIRVTCPSCGGTGVLSHPEDKGGAVSIRCPRCGHAFRHALERRRAPRKIPLPKARYGFFDHDFKKLTKQAEVADVSMTGLKLHTQERLFEGERVGVAFRLPGHPSWIKAGAKVVRVLPLSAAEYEVGLEFVFLSPDARKAIHFYMMG